MLSSKNLAKFHRSKSLDHIPECDTVIDLTVLKKDNLKKEFFRLIQSLFPEWADSAENFEINRVSGALTNAVFFVDATNRKRMLLRVYGIGVDQLIDRENELSWIARLSQLNIGPSLLGVFGNGRFEEYLPSRTLTSQDIRSADISCQIAARIRELHDIVAVYPPNEKSVIEVWNNVDKWYKLVMDILPDLIKKSDGWATSLASFDLKRLANEIETSKKMLKRIESPVVFGQNDSQYGNVLQMNKSQELVIVDFDYAGYNPRGFDIANHFCEWMYDYHSEEPAAMNKEKYPTNEEQTRFLTAYLDTTNRFTKPGANENMTCEDLQKEVAMYSMISHLSWGLWGLIQANQSEIEFDYFLYSSQRLNAFREEFKKWEDE